MEEETEACRVWIADLGDLVTCGNDNARGQDISVDSGETVIATGEVLGSPRSTRKAVEDLASPSSCLSALTNLAVRS